MQNCQSPVSVSESDTIISARDAGASEKCCYAACLFYLAFGKPSWHRTHHISRNITINMLLPSPHLLTNRNQGSSSADQWSPLFQEFNNAATTVLDRFPFPLPSASGLVKLTTIVPFLEEITLFSVYKSTEMLSGHNLKWLDFLGSLIHCSVTLKSFFLKEQIDPITLHLYLDQHRMPTLPSKVFNGPQ